MISSTTFKEGDLVFWVEPGKEASVSGVIVEIYPRNLYEPEACLVFSNEDFVAVETKYLREAVR